MNGWLYTKFQARFARHGLDQVVHYLSAAADGYVTLCQAAAGSDEAAPTPPGIRRCERCAALLAGLEARQ